VTGRERQGKSTEVPCDLHEHTLEFLYHFAILKSQYLDPGALQERIPALIPQLCSVMIVRCAVKFDGEPLAHAVEVQHVLPDPVLAPKSSSSDLPALEMFPQDRLRGRESPAQAAAVGCSPAWIVVRHARDNVRARDPEYRPLEPSPALCANPPGWRGM
jgi:hypothetical protein